MASKGEYKMINSTLPTDLRMRWNNLTVGSDGKFNSSTICQGDDFLTNFVFQPAIEETLRKFMRTCLPEGATIIQNDWTLCTDNRNFSCEAIMQYARTCRRSYVPDMHTTTVPCTMSHLMQDDVSAILLLIGLVLIGILLGVAGTMAVCLICPGVHKWAMRRIRGDICYKEDTIRASTVSSEYYAAIEDNRNTNIRLRPIQKLPVPQTDHHLHNDSGISPSGSPIGHPDFDDLVYQSNAISEEPVYSDTTDSGMVDHNYEGLNRTDSHSQSHKYAQITGNSRSMDTMSPQSVNSEGHGYFTLEKIS